MPSGLSSISSLGAMTYCPPQDKQAEELTCYIEIYPQCVPLDANNLIIELTPKDLVGGGNSVASQMQRQNTSVSTSASTTPIYNLRGGLDIKYTVQIQNGSADKWIDETIEGVKYEDIPSAPGYERILFADRTGELVPRYQVAFRVMSGNKEKYTDIINNAEIQVTNRGGMGAGTLYNVTLEIMALPLDDIIGTRVERIRKK